MFLTVAFDRGGRNIYHARLMFARPLIDSVDFARNGKELAGKIRLEDMPRLQDIWAGAAGEMSFCIKGRLDEGKEMLDLSFQGKCLLLCQRCLGGLLYPMDTTMRLWLLPANRLAEGDEDVDLEVLEASAALDVWALIEDELLLGLPYAPKHPEGACAAAQSEKSKPEGVFSVLAKLKV